MMILKCIKNNTEAIFEAYLKYIKYKKTYQFTYLK